jgi:hypothetical protein
MSTVGTLLGALALPIAAAGLAVSTHLRKEAQRLKNQVRESGSIQRAASVALPQAQRGAQAYETLLPTADTEAEWRAVLDAAQRGVGAGAALSHYVSTHGGRTYPGAPAGPSIDYAPLVERSMVAQLAAHDALARLGVDLGAEGGWSMPDDPRFFLNVLAGAAGGTNFYGYGVPEGSQGVAPSAADLARWQPGHYLDALETIYRTHVPGYAQSRLAALIAPVRGTA